MVLWVFDERLVLIIAFTTDRDEADQRVSWRHLQLGTLRELLQTCVIHTPSFGSLETAPVQAQLSADRIFAGNFLVLLVPRRFSCVCHVQRAKFDAVTAASRDMKNSVHFKNLLKIILAHGKDFAFEKCFVWLSNVGAFRQLHELWQRGWTGVGIQDVGSQ